MTALAWAAVSVLIGIAGFLLWSVGYMRGYHDGSDRTALEFTLRLGRRAD